MRAFLLSLPLVWLPLLASAETVNLLMAEEDGCMWCARWESDVGIEYPKTAEGASAPLIKHDIHADLPEGVALTRPLQFTPTFVLLVDGAEVGRIEGYPGEDFFWGLLSKLISDVGIEASQKPEASS